ncbi:MAG TPA: hypothetical protein VGB73_09550 [Pyrinomonadaceae bacterium]|jgi:hypothetical protein
MLKIAMWGMLMTACAFFGGSGNDSAEGGSQGGQGGSQGWMRHQDPSGFELEIPRGWRVIAGQGRIAAEGPNMERVFIMPLQIEGQLDGRRAQGVLMGLSSQLWPRQKWVMPRSGWQFGTNGVRAVGLDDSTLRETTALWWANTPRGATVFFYAVAGQPASYQSLEPVFARVLGSFRVTHVNQQQAGAMGGGDPLASMQFQRWVDPTENAFSIEAPAGWRVSGGIKRERMIGRRSEFVAQSPDGQVTVRSGDVNVPDTYIEPSQTIMSLGYREGQMYSGGIPIYRFMPAVVFATNYVQMNVGRNCGNLQWLAQRDRPDYVQQLARQGFLVQGNHYTAGEVAFTCQAGGQPYVGYLFVETYAAPDMGVATMWYLKAIYGFLASANRAKEGDAVLQRAIGSFQLNPQWWAAQRQGEARTAEDLRRYNEFSYNLQKQMQNERWASWDRIAEQRGDVLSGQTRVVDPQTGQAYKAQSGSNYYWIDPTRNVIAGTNLPYQPTWDFREMVQTYR